MFYWEFWVHNPHPESVRGDYFHVSVDYGIRDYKKGRIATSLHERHIIDRTHRFLNPVVLPDTYVKISGLFEVAQKCEYEYSLPKNFIFAMDRVDRSSVNYRFMREGFTYRYPISWRN